MKGELRLVLYTKADGGGYRAVAESKVSVSVEMLEEHPDSEEVIRYVVRNMFDSSRDDLTEIPPDLTEEEKGDPAAVNARESKVDFQKNVFRAIINSMR